MCPRNTDVGTYPTLLYRFPSSQAKDTKVVQSGVSIVCLRRCTCSNFALGDKFVNLVNINPFPNKPRFLRVYSASLLKTLLEKEKLLTSNFSFSHSVLYPFEELSAIFIKFEIVICRLFQFGTV